MDSFWFDFCFTALQHILGNFGCGQLTYPHCSWASLLGSLPVLSAHSFASNWHLLFLNQRKRENGRRNVFMTKSPRKNVPDVGIELGAACMPSKHASDWATAPGHTWIVGRCIVNTGIRLLLLICPFIYSFSFLSKFQHWIFSSHFSQELWRLEDWHVASGIRLLLLICPFISSFFFLSNFQTLKFFVTLLTKCEA